MTLRHLTPDEVHARMRDPRFQITDKEPDTTRAPCIVCEREDVHVDGGGSHYTCSGVADGVEHLYCYCVDGAGCSGNDGANEAQVSPFYAGKDYLGSKNGDGFFVVWRCPCESLLPRQGWKPSMGDECPDYSTAYDVVGDECHVCGRRRDDPRRPRAGRAD